MSAQADSTTLTPRLSDAVSSIWQQIRVNLQTYTLITAAVLIWLFFNYRTDGMFLSPRNFSNLFRQMTVTAFLSVGMVLVIVTGNIDLSVGKLAGFVSVMVAYYQAYKLAGWLPEEVALLGQTIDQDIMIAVASVLIGVGVGLLVGIIQGYIIAYLNVTAFIVTLGSMWLFNGLILLRTDGRTIPANKPLFSDIAQGYLTTDAGWILAGATVLFLFLTMFRSRRKKRKYNFEIPPLGMDIAKVTGLSALVLLYVNRVNDYKGFQNPVLLLAIVVILITYISNNTRFGRYAYAIGGNREAAQLSGVNIRRNIFMVFVLMGFLCGVSGVTMASYVGYGTISAGQGYELDAIAACILGGTSTLGGVGTVVGAMVGALIMASLTNGLQLLNTPSAYQYVLKGIVLVVAVYADVRLSRGRG